MLPFDRVFTQLARQEVGVIYALQDARLPDGTYKFHEYFCGAPCCKCRRVSLRVRLIETGRLLASLTFELEPPEELRKGGARVSLDQDQPQSELADRLAFLFERMIEWDDPGYADQLARHYDLWRQVVEDPLHPSHERLREALREESPGSSRSPCCCVQ